MNRFRKEKGKHLEEIFVQVVQKAKDMKLIKFGTCSLDGSKFYASAGKGKNKSPDDLEKEIQKLIDEAERIDEIEDAEYGDEVDDMDPELRTKEGRAKRKQEIEKQKKREENKKKMVEKEIEETPINTKGKKLEKVNTTDKDSRLMKMKRGDFANGYNIQNITENGIILSTTISHSSSDQATVVETVGKLTKNNKKPKILLADKGYSSEENYEYCEKEEIDAYIPIHTEQVDMSQ